MIENWLKVLIFNTDTNSFILVRQFRLPVYVHKEQQGEKVTGSDGLTLEVCAGIVDKDMSYIEHAVAEVSEETGYRVTADRLELINCYLGAVGISGIHARAYYVQVTNQDVCTVLTCARL